MIAEPKKTGTICARRDLRPQLRLEEAVAQIAAGAVELLDHALVRLRKEIDHRFAPGRAARSHGDDRRRPVADPVRRSHRHDAQFQLAPDVVEQRLAARAETVDLVDEDEHREVGRADCPRQAARLRLHALDGRDDQHDAIEHAQRTLDLGDEVGVSGGIDQIDLERR